ncbi:MAG: biopolymer transport protein ExbB, partial [Psychrobacter glaciei]
MKTVFKSILAAASITLMASSAQAATTLEQLLDEVKNSRVSEARINKKREAEFQSARADKQALLRKAQSDLKSEESRGDRLQKAFADNEVRLADKEVELTTATGTLGEMFGVVRQASAEAYGQISTSIVSAEFPGRGAFLKRMSEEAKGLPNIKELEDLWFALQTEMTESGQVSRFTAEVVNLDGGSQQQEVVRVGTFNLLGEQGYLVYDDQNEMVQPLGRQPDSFQTTTAQALHSANSGLIPFYADPSRGGILSLLKEKATMMERYHAGGTVGYTITVMLAIGLIIGLYKLITLTLVGAKMKAQLKNVSNPSSN